MWSKSVAALAICQFLAPLSVHAAATWPNDIDEIEDLMFLQTGYRSLGFASAVTPCSKGPADGFVTAAGFLRVAFHDVAAHLAATQSGGLDASIGYELADEFKDSNSGPAFWGAISYYNDYFNSKASMADLIALGAYSAVRSCQGPTLDMKVGRIDATRKDRLALPDAQDSATTLKTRFLNMGFSSTEMIQLVACGHTLGAVHPGVNGAFKPQDPNAAAEASANGGALEFDTTDAQFDNRVVTEYLGGRSKNPLVSGPAAFNSDARVFKVDNNVTVNDMKSPSVFQGVCQQILNKMLEKVPSQSKLSAAIQPYDVKPGQLNLQVVENGKALIFSGEIRVRSSAVGSSTPKMTYTGRSGDACTDCDITLTKAGTAQGWDNTYTFYGFSKKITSITSFKVSVGGVTFDNNGNGFPVNDGVFVQKSSSSLSGGKLNVVVAVRAGSGGAPTLSLSRNTGFKFNSLPKVSKSSATTSKICSDSLWSYYSGSFSGISDADQTSGKLDVLLGSTTVDAFRSLDFASSAVAPKCDASTSSSSSSSSKTSSSSTLTSSVSTTKSSSLTTTTSKTTSGKEDNTSKTTSGKEDNTSKTTTGKDSNTSKTTTDKEDNTSKTTTSKKEDNTSKTTTEDKTTSTEKATTTDKPDGDKTTSTTEKDKDTSKTSTATWSTKVPDWREWNPDKNGDERRKKHEKADAALEAAYKELCNKPAPNGGTNGKDKNLEGINFNIPDRPERITITGTKVVYTVATYEVNYGKEAEPTVDAAGEPWAPVAAPTDYYGSPAPDSGKPDYGKPDAASPEAWSSAAAPAANTWAGYQPSATKGSPMAKYTGAANKVARGETVLMGAAAIVGVVALAL